MICDHCHKDVSPQPLYKSTHLAPLNGWYCMGCITQINPTTAVLIAHNPVFKKVKKLASVISVEETTPINKKAIIQKIKALCHQ